MEAGMWVPAVTLGRIVDGGVSKIRLFDTIRDKRVVIVGVIGAFTPVCTQEHAPDFVRQADHLKSLGFDLVICVAPNDPWTVEAWSRPLDPNGKVLFLADGNLELARRLGVTFDGRGLQVGETSRRYLLVAQNGRIERLSVEPSPTMLTCTQPADALHTMREAA